MQNSVLCHEKMVVGLGNLGLIRSPRGGGGAAEDLKNDGSREGSWSEME